MFCGLSSLRCRISGQKLTSAQKNAQKVAGYQVRWNALHIFPSAVRLQGEKNMALLEVGGVGQERSAGNLQGKDGSSVA